MTNTATGQHGSARLILRLSAVAVAIAGFIDPAVARRLPAPLAIDLRLPPVSDAESARARRLRDEVADTLGERVVMDGSLPPRAVVAIGNASLPHPIAAPVFAVPLTARSPSTAIVAVNGQAWTTVGQVAKVNAVVLGRGLTGRRTTVRLELRGSVVGTREHVWSREDDRFEAQFAHAPAVPGVERARIVARTEGVPEESVADTVVVTRTGPLRVLAFEPRPSWPLAFVRRSLERDALFTVSVTSRSSRPAATTSGAAPVTLADLDVDRFDAIFVGAPEDLRERDLSALDRFVERRGGTLVLMPDRRLPDPIRRHFDLPSADELLVETPMAVDGGHGTMRASELLLMPASSDWKTLASVRQGASNRPVIVVADRGAGRVVLSGALDAWRYRADESGGFDTIWRALAADAAMAAPHRLAVSVTPSIARPGDEIVVTASLREAEVGLNETSLSLPPVAGSVVGPDGRHEMIRLWPGSRAGQYEGRLIAARDGRHVVSASAGTVSAQVPLLVAADVVHPTIDLSAASAHAAGASGGAVVADGNDLPRALTSVDRGVVEKTTRPMRSVWWLVPFSLLLCAEWTLRRRSGLT